MQFQGCHLMHPKWVDSVSYGKQAIKKAYHLSKADFVYNGVIDTTTVYVSENTYVATNRQGETDGKEFMTYNIILFSGEGTALFQSFMLEIPNEVYHNELFQGQYCFYAILDNEIKIESYNHDTRMFEYWFGKVQDNGDIYFYKSKGRPFGTYKRRISYTFRKTNIIITKPLEFPE